MKKGFGLLFIILLTVQLVKAQEDTIQVRFPFDASSLTQDAIQTLNQFVASYRSGTVAPQLTLRGHCDAIGSDTYNDRLSTRRVAAVRNYLTRQGIPDTVIRFSQGFGEREPVQDNATAMGRQQNRRVEIIWAQPIVTKTEPPPAAAITPKDTIPELTRETIKTIREGQTLRLRNINFHGGSHIFLPQSQPALDELLAVMKDHPTLVIEIQGHICCMPGSRDGFDYDSNDWNLSHNRARAVYEFLNKNGIHADRMSYRGFAGRVPLVYPEYTDEDRTANRRVEIKIIKR